MAFLINWILIVKSQRGMYVLENKTSWVDKRNKGQISGLVIKEATLEIPLEIESKTVEMMHFITIYGMLEHDSNFNPSLVKLVDMLLNIKRFSEIQQSILK